MKRVIFISLMLLLMILQSCSESKKIDAVKNVFVRIGGNELADNFEFKLVESVFNNDSYIVKTENDKIIVSGNSQIALCRGAYDFLFNSSESIISWSGNKINIPKNLPQYSNEVESPYKYRYYFNSVTHGYSTPFWNWERWEKEIDWMAVHGINMPLMGIGYEAILNRVLIKIGLTKDEIDKFFSGPAYLPWNRMGNLTGWQGKLPKDFFNKQIELNHKILERYNELGIKPIIQAFAGFVPEDIIRIYPNEILRNMNWGGFDKKYNSHILEPGSDLFIKIGNMYIEEWEKEFGPAEFYLADSFNEMDVPLAEDSTKALIELADYGKAVFKSINDANSNATWVMQGWTFPYMKKDGKLFWTPEKLKALISEVPDDKLLILDLANEYNLLWWKIDPSWKIYDGFFGKQWIYSYIPNMGGKVSLNGNLEIYSSASIDALNFERKGNLVGFGFAPEGIENNEIIYELLSEMGWTNKKINLDEWIEKYCKSRYGGYPSEMKHAYDNFRKSCFGTFTDHPRHRYQFRPNMDQSGSVNKSEEFKTGVKEFLNCKDKLGDNNLYLFDAIELTSQYLGLVADELLKSFIDRKNKNDYSKLNEAMEILDNIDRLLESHPNHNLSQWINLAQNFGSSDFEKRYYEQNARRLITTWGGWVNEYSARTWSGLIRDYYIPRWKLFYEAEKNSEEFDLLNWEENWINSTGISEIEEFEDPLEKAVMLVKKYSEKNKY
ncbi:MAG: alpha-N-acetylglucosaminidase [Ignavibacteriae bacterium]|nr:alpha-N-acetylglucosaminidase [Ignavibacteriota bacterium]